MTDALQQRLTEAFQKMLSDEPEGGASLALYYKGEKIISLHGGCRDEAKTKPWTAETLTLIWSAGKGIGSACLLHALQEKGISLDEKVATFWPEFAAAGKEKITIAQLLSHRAGLAALDQKGLSLIDHNAVAKALAAQAPNWNYDGSHGYGARTFGFLIDELLRRVSDEASLATYWRRVFADPLELDLWFGIPEKELARAAAVIPLKTPPPPSDFGNAYQDQASLTRRAFSEPGANATTLAMNQPELRQAAIISSGAMSTADALAKFYSLLTIQQNNKHFTLTTRRWMETPLACGVDRVFLAETIFSAGFMMNNSQKIMGPSPRSFGHPGAGGAIAFADPEREWGFAFLPNKMHPGVLSSLRTQRLVEALYKA